MKPETLGITKIIAILTIACSVLIGCASQQAKVSSDQFSGYLNDYTKLTKVNGKEAFRWISDEAKSGGYNKVMFDKTVVYPPSVSTPFLEDVAAIFDHALRKSFTDSVEVVTQPGPGVLHIKPAITGLTSETEGVKAYEFIPIAAIYNGFKAAMGWRSKVTQVFLEADLVDSISGKSIAAVVRKGTNEQLTQEKVRLSDVRPIVQKWASEGAASIKTMMSNGSTKTN
ncbi:MAG: hypothetical protein COA46_03050 [Porticoccaceae bacterium]|nr:MAG: hypothetical protein COA46_03050 [Porticoccaceae bacterium]